MAAGEGRSFDTSCAVNTIWLWRTSVTREDIPASKSGTGFERLLTPTETADRLRVSLSWLAKARMQGDGPPFVKFGRSIRYAEGTLVQFIKANLRQSTNK